MTKLGKRHGADGLIVNDENVIHRLLISGQFETDSFVDAAADLVAANGGFEDFFGNNNSEALTPARVVIIDQR